MRRGVINREKKIKVKNKSRGEGKIRVKKL